MNRSQFHIAMTQCRQLQKTLQEVAQTHMNDTSLMLCERLEDNLKMDLILAEKGHSKRQGRKRFEAIC